MQPPAAGSDDDGRRPSQHVSHGEPGDADPQALLPLVYDQLRAVAAEYLRREGAGHTLQPTALVHEAYLRLAKLDRYRWADKTHFFVVGAEAIRRVLVDHARAKGAAKRGGGARRLTLSGLGGLDGATTAPDLDLLALDEALERLAALDARKARVVALRFFGGLTLEEVARTLQVGVTTVKDDWAYARAWLLDELDTP